MYPPTFFGFSSRRFASRGILRHLNLQPEEFVLNSRRFLRHLLQHTGHRHLPRDPAHEVELHAVDGSSDFVRRGPSSRSGEQRRARRRARQRTAEGHRRDQKQIEGGRVVRQEVLLPATGNGHERRLRSWSDGDGRQSAAAGRPGGHQKLHREEKAAVAQRVRDGWVKGTKFAFISTIKLD